MIELNNARVHIGVIEDHDANNHHLQDDFWWWAAYGYAYFSGYNVSRRYHNGKTNNIEYGKVFGEGDIIDIWLDLKRNDLSFGKNGISFGKAFDVKSCTNYRFVLGVLGANPYVNWKVHIVSIEVTA